MNLQRTKMVFAVLVSAVVFAGCADFFSPVRDYLKEYTENAAIESMDINAPVMMDVDGYPSIRSSDHVALRFRMRNPRRYNLQATVHFSDPDIDAISGSDYFFVLSADRQTMELVFLNTFLRIHDGAENNLSGMVVLSDPASGRSFAPYSFRLRSNTPPPRPSGLRIMQAAGKYVVCFNLDLSDDIHHNDITTVYINNVNYPVDTVVAGMAAQDIVFSDSGSANTSAPGGLAALGDPGAVFSPDPAQVPVYIQTGVSVSDENQEFTVRLVDRKGLGSSAVTTSRGTRLGPVLLFDPQGNALSGSLQLATLADTGAAQIDMRAPVVDVNGEPVIGARVHYEYVKDSVFQGSGSSPVASSLWLGRGGYTLRLWASKSGYLDSDVVSIPVSVKGMHLFVHPSTGDDTTGDGSRTKPYKTITNAFSTIPAGDGEVYVINLLGDVTDPEADAGDQNMVSMVKAPPQNPRTVIVDGRGFAIDGGDTRRGLEANTMNLDLTLRNLTIRNGRTVNADGAGIHFSGGGKLSITAGTRIMNNRITGAGIRYGGGYLIL